MSLITELVNKPSIIMHLIGLDGSISHLIDSFLDILEMHQNLTDPLSIDLLKWGEELAELLNSSELLNAKHVASQFYKIRKIIVNPLDGSPIQHPRISGGRLWEEWMLNQIKELFDDVSCYPDNAPLDLVENHSFAESLLRWQETVFKLDDIKIKEIKKELDLILLLEDRGGWLDKEECLRSRPYLAIKGYVELATNADQYDHFISIAKKVEKASGYFEFVCKSTEERTKTHVEAARLSLIESEKRISADLKEIQSTYERVIKNLRESVEKARIENLILQERIESAEGKISDLTSRVSDLEGRVHAAEAQNHVNWQAANSRNSSKCVVM